MFYMEQSELIIERHSKKEIIYNYLDNEIVSEYPPKRMNNATKKVIRDIKGMSLEEIKNYFKKGLQDGSLQGVVRNSKKD